MVVRSIWHPGGTACWKGGLDSRRVLRRRPSEPVGTIKRPEGADMRKVIVTEWMSLDEVVQAPGAADEDPTGGFAHGGWHLRYFDDLSQTWVVETLTAAGGFLLGRRTYDGFAAHWPNPSEEQVVAEPLNIRPKYGPSTDQRLRHGWLQSSPVVDAFALPVPGQGP